VVLAGAIGPLREAMAGDMSSADAGTREAATVSAIIDRTLMRIGGGGTEEDTGSVGATTLRAEHVTVDGDMVRFRFPGKSGVEWDVSVEDAAIARSVMASLAGKAPGDAVFGVGRQGVNAYLTRHAGVTAKDFRTFHASRIAYSELSKLGVPGTMREAKANVTAAIAVTAKALGHKPAVCKSAYVNPAVLERYFESVAKRTRSAA